MISTLTKKKSESLSKRASKSIVSQTLTYSKQACRYVEGVYPQYAQSGYGCMLYDTDNNEYIDYVCGLGVNLLGYAYPSVCEAVKDQIDWGVLFSLPHPSEIKLAEKLKQVIPSMELMRFLKSGSEAVSAGIKIARAYTGKDIVLSNGYHGWHDWSTPITANNSGTPRSFFDSIKPFEYNNLDSLKKHLELKNVACVVLDPYVFDAPQGSFLSDLVKLSHKYGALVLFDEVVTGLRWSKFSVQSTYNVKPDLTALGKTLGNGFAISCIGGKASVMRVLDKDCFVSSTYGGDLVGISAALRVLDIITSEPVTESIEESGFLLQQGINEIASLKGINIKCDGSVFRQRMNFPSNEHKALFWQECVKRGIFFGAAQHTSYAHKVAIIERTLDIVSESIDTCLLYWDNPKKGLEGKPPVQVATISNLRK